MHYLIEAFGNFGFKPKQLVKLNRCRLYLQVISLADIVDGLGKLIYPKAYLGVKLIVDNQYLSNQNK